jgi:hypothetical protein
MHLNKKECLSSNKDKQPTNITRREALTNIFSAISLVAISGQMTSACSYGFNIGGNKFLDSYKNNYIEYYNNIDDPKGYLSYLKKREFIVKDKILSAYAEAITDSICGTPKGGYIHRVFLGNSERKNFKETLKKLGLNNEEIEFYVNLFSTPDTIVLSESTLSQTSLEIYEDESLEYKDSFLVILHHERIHQALKKLDQNELKILRSAAKEFINEDRKRKTEALDLDIFGELIDMVDKNKYPKEKQLLLNERFNGDNPRLQITKNNEEFYPYLGCGSLRDEAELEFKKRYPEAYLIFSKLRDSCKPQKN